MSSCEVAQFLRKKAEESGLSHSEITRLAKVSRQTWYKLLNGDVQEAKLSTIIRISEALRIHPLDLMALYFERRQRSLHSTHNPFYTATQRVTRPG